MLLTTHYMEEAATLCDRVAIMDQASSSPRAHPQSWSTASERCSSWSFETNDGVDIASLERLDGVQSVTRRERQYRLRLGRNLKRLTTVLSELDRQRVVPIGLSAHQATLDDVFLQLTGHGLQGATAGEEGES